MALQRDAMVPPLAGGAPHVRLCTLHASWQYLYPGSKSIGSSVLIFSPPLFLPPIMALAEAASVFGCPMSGESGSSLVDTYFLPTTCIYYQPRRDDQEISAFYKLQRTASPFLRPDYSILLGDVTTSP